MRAVLLALLISVLVFLICMPENVAARRQKKRTRRNSKFFSPPKNPKAKHLRHHNAGYSSKDIKNKPHFKLLNKPITTAPHKHQNVHTLPVTEKPAVTPTPVPERKVASTFALRTATAATCTQCPTEKVGFCGGPSKDLCDKSFNSYVLALTWPSGFCKQITSRNGASTCKLPSNKSVDFSIHGLWPQSKRTCSFRIEDRNGQPQTKTIPLPQYCRSNAPFVIPATNSPLYSKLIQYWVSYNDIGANVNGNHDLWCHEWHAHGSCVEEWDSQTYLQQTIRIFETKLLRQKKSIISQLNLQPSNRPIAKNSLLSAFQTSFGVTPSLTCALDRQTRVEYLREVTFCFDKQFNLKNADFCGLRSSCQQQELLFPL